MSGTLQNLTTPFKASVVALLAHKMVTLLGFTDVDGQYVAEALWMLITATLAFALPADLGLSGMSSKLLGFALRLINRAPTI